ncbi:hypothetical protein [Streptomyces bicolor]|nr:hypothetical protein [Streptomyces bicolor]
MYTQEHGTYPEAAALAAYVYERDRITGAGGQPLTGDDLKSLVLTFHQRKLGKAEGPGAEPAPAPAHQQPADADLPTAGDHPEQVPTGAGAQAAKETRSPHISATLDTTEPDGSSTTGEPATLTTVDRYYLAWAEYQTQTGEEPKADQLSAYLAAQGMNGRGGKAVSPSTLRRYLLPFRVYRLWAEQRIKHNNPPLHVIAQECADHGITAQHNRPLTTDYIAEQAGDFERRWQALTRHHTEAQKRHPLPTPHTQPRSHTCP